MGLTLSIQAYLKRSIEHKAKQYLQKANDLNTIDINLYDKILAEMERPLIKYLWHQANGNQSLMASWLGISRVTLRTKMQGLGLLCKRKPLF